MKYLYLWCILLLVGCSANFTDNDDLIKSNQICGAVDNNTVNDQNCKPELIKVNIEDSFTLDKKIKIATAFTQWSIKSNSQVEFDISFILTDDMVDSTSIKNTFSIFNRAPDNLYFAGYAYWNPIIHGAVIELSPKINDDVFIPVVLHEIGHALGLNHYEGTQPSIMDSALRNGFEITCLDLQAFSKLWNCTTKCDSAQMYYLR